MKRLLFNTLFLVFLICIAWGVMCGLSYILPLKTIEKVIVVEHRVLNTSGSCDQVDITTEVLSVGAAINEAVLGGDK